MSSQMLLGSSSSSVVTAQTVDVLAFSSSGEARASVVFRSNGAQQIERNNSFTGLSNWVTPAFLANEWEIRAILENGVTPDTGVLNTWQPLTSDRIWTISRFSVGSSQCFLTFEFRRTGTADPEVTISGNNLYAERLGFL